MSVKTTPQHRAAMIEMQLLRLLQNWRALGDHSRDQIPTERLRTFRRAILNLHADLAHEEWLREAGEPPC